MKTYACVSFVGATSARHPSVRAPLVVAALATLVLATACSRPVAVPRAALFADDGAGGLPFDGLRYRAVPSGLADEVIAGEFCFQPQDVVTFYLGDYPLGTVRMGDQRRTVTLDELEVTHVAVDQRDGYIAATRQLLRSLDSDRDIANGVTIAPEDRALFAGEQMSSHAIVAMRRELVVLGGSAPRVVVR